VVDARTGNILYFGTVLTPTESIANNPQKSQKWFNSFFKKFPEAKS
jgi:hypothetical protein